MAETPGNKEGIKVTDRRSFRPDGTRRDSETEPGPVPIEASEIRTDAPSSVPPGAIRGEGFTMEHGPAAGSPPREADTAGDAMFMNLVVSLYQSGCIHLGLAEDPEGDDMPVDLEAAHGTIEMLRSVQKKTIGNLTPDERRILESLLAELQLNFSMKKSSPA